MTLPALRRVRVHIADGRHARLPVRHMRTAHRNQLPCASSTPKRRPRSGTARTRPAQTRRHVRSACESAPCAQASAAPAAPRLQPRPPVQAARPAPYATWDAGPPRNRNAVPPPAHVPHAASYRPDPADLPRPTPRSPLRHRPSRTRPAGPAAQRAAQACAGCAVRRQPPAIGRICRLQVGNGIGRPHRVRAQHGAQFVRAGRPFGAGQNRRRVHQASLCAASGLRRPASDGSAPKTPS